MIGNWYDRSIFARAGKKKSEESKTRIHLIVITIITNIFAIFLFPYEENLVPIQIVETMLAIYITYVEPNDIVYRVFSHVESR